MSPYAGLTEIRGAFRGLQRSPTIALSAVVCIALGLGSTAAISSAVDRALVQLLPFRAPERIVTVYRTTPHFDTGPFSPLNYLDLARLSTSVPELAAIGYGTGLLALPNQAVQVDLKRASANLFPMLGVQALRGRLILPEDDGLDREPVAVLRRGVLAGAVRWRPGRRGPQHPARRDSVHRGRRGPSPLRRAPR